MRTSPYDCSHGKKYEYQISATTEKERIEERIKKAKEESELELAKTITRIRETGY